MPAGKPIRGGKPTGAGKPDSPGKPDSAGKPDGGGKPDGARVMAEPWLPPRARWIVAVLAAIYALFVWMDGAVIGLPDAILPLPVRFFLQEAALFPHSARDAIEWRAEGWRCDLGRFEEIDVRPFFPIRRDDKESRFYRAMFFHYRQRRVLEALDKFIVEAHNRAHPEARIGGVMLLDLRIPIPPPGTPERRYERLPLTDYPQEVERKYWYVTSSDDRTHRCEEQGTP